MKERPILFSGEMVRAILDGRKTQTRRGVKLKDLCWSDTHGYDWAFRDRRDLWNDVSSERLMELCPYGKTGDRLWVRETWRIGAWDQDEGSICVDFRADGFCDKKWRRVPDPDWFEQIWISTSDELHRKGIAFDEEGMYRWEPGESPLRWRPSIYMPRWASRISLEIVSVRVEQVQDISEEDAKAEGAPLCHVPDLGQTWKSHKSGFEILWNSINEKRGFGWDANPWVWAVDFKVVK